MREIKCYGQTGTTTWTQEKYETASGDAKRRAQELRKAGFLVITASLGPQITTVGLVKISLVTVLNAGAHELPPVKIERL